MIHPLVTTPFNLLKCLIQQISSPKKNLHTTHLHEDDRVELTDQMMMMMMMMMMMLVMMMGLVRQTDPRSANHQIPGLKCNDTKCDK
jgi:hypothetical protein